MRKKNVSDGWIVLSRFSTTASSCRPVQMLGIPKTHFMKCIRKPDVLNVKEFNRLFSENHAERHAFTLLLRRYIYITAITILLLRPIVAIEPL